jgi:hypothetical protein
MNAITGGLAGRAINCSWAGTNVLKISDTLEVIGGACKPNNPTFSFTDSTNSSILLISKLEGHFHITNASHASANIHITSDGGSNPWFEGSCLSPANVNMYGIGHYQVAAATTININHEQWEQINVLIHTGRAQAGAASTITLDNTYSSGTVDFYNNDYYVNITEGTGAGQVRRITDYDQTTKIATVDRAWNTTPGATSVYTIFALPNTLANTDVNVESWNGTLVTGDGDWAELQTDVDLLLTNLAIVNTNVNDIETLLGAVNTNVNDIETLLGTVNTNVNDIETLLGTVNTNVNDIETLLGTVNTNVNDIETLLGTVNTNVNDIETLLGTVNTNVNDIETLLGTVNTNVNDIETLLGTVNTNVSAIKTITDKLPIKRNVAIANFYFVLFDTNGNVVTGLGATPVASVSKDGAALVPLAGPVAEVGVGIYKVPLTAGETNFKDGMYTFTGAGAVTTFKEVITESV